MNLTAQKRLLFHPAPQKNPISHQSPFPQIQILISIDKAHSINKIDSGLQCYTNVYNALGVSLTLFALWVTSELLTATAISISESQTDGRQVLCKLPCHFANWPRSWLASSLLYPSHAKLCSGFEMHTNKLSSGSFQHAELTNAWIQVSGWRCLHKPWTVSQPKSGISRPLVQVVSLLYPLFVTVEKRQV